ncbi:MAG: DUF192 domain-containing protein [Opitutales bacterium]|nr:DUF192 domain-containing protein [Opitutales bacterium]
MKIFRILSVFAAGLAAAFLCACAQKNDFSTQYPLSIISGDSRADFSARIAASPSENARGLMGVESLPENSGMLFVADAPKMASFWMKNTLIPLDIAFIDPEGRILQISKMHPHSLEPVRSVSDRVLFCLEMNGGWFEKNKISTGSKLDTAMLQKALDKRLSAKK